MTNCIHPDRIDCKYRRWSGEKNDLGTKINIMCAYVPPLPAIHEVHVKDKFGHEQVGLKKKNVRSWHCVYKPKK